MTPNVKPELHFPRYPFFFGTHSDEFSGKVPGGWAPRTDGYVVFITMVIVESSPKDRVVGPLPNGRTSWLKYMVVILITYIRPGMILQVPSSKLKITGWKTPACEIHSYIHGGNFKKTTMATPTTHSANGPWKKKFERLIFPTKYSSSQKV